MIFNDVELLPYVREAVTGTELDPDFVLSEIRSVIEAQISGRLMNTSARSGLAVAQLLVPKRKPVADRLLN